MLTIGFANKFYTLWDVYSREESGVDAVGQIYKFERIFHDFKQNLGLNFEESKMKTAALSDGCFDINLELKGSGSFYIDKNPNQKIAYENDKFPYGKLAGENIDTCTDSWQLNRLFNDQSANAKSRVYARKKLIELGYLIRVEKEFYDGYINRYLDSNTYENLKKRVYFDSLLKDHHFADGEKVNLNLTEVNRFSFDTKFGYTTIVNYVDDAKRLFKYMGSSPLESTTEKITVKATIKHDSYEGKNETKLIRMKIL